MKALTLSGWGQPHDALKAIAPDATHVDYARAESVAAALAIIAQEATQHDVIIGWSLGAQLAVRALAAKMVAPRALVLIAPPFQFVASPKKDLGMKRDLYEKFRDNYARNPARTLDKAWELVVKGDAHTEEVREYLAQQDKAQVLAKDWLQWLHLLDGFSCEDLYLADFPPTLIVHGKDDAVIDSVQAGYFTRTIPKMRSVLWEECGHAPHWHDSAALKTLVAEHCGV